MEPIIFNYDTFKQVVEGLVANNVTDFHISPGCVPFIRQAKALKELLYLPLEVDEVDENDSSKVKKVIHKLPVKIMLPADTMEFVCDLIRDSQSDPEKAHQLIDQINKREIDTTLSIPGVSRFRIHISLQRSSVTCSIRVVPNKIPSLSGFPTEITQLNKYHSGLIIVSGKTSSGKTTTLATLIDDLNLHENRKIITLEDPIEYLHKHNHCMVVQREIGIDTQSYKTGLLSALREDPDVIVIGELRDMDSFEIVLNAAESGCLVLTTMHSATAQEALERIVSMFPDDKQNQVKSQLATVLKGIVCQQLIPCCDKDYDKELVAAFEILTSNTSVAHAIRKGNFSSIPNIMSTNKKMNMKTMKDSLRQLKENGLISQEEWFIRDNNLATTND